MSVKESAKAQALLLKILLCFVFANNEICGSALYFYSVQATFPMTSCPQTIWRLSVQRNPKHQSFGSISKWDITTCPGHTGCYTHIKALLLPPQIVQGNMERGYPSCRKGLCTKEVYHKLISRGSLTRLGCRIRAWTRGINVWAAKYKLHQLTVCYQSQMAENRRSDLGASSSVGSYAVPGMDWFPHCIWNPTSPGKINPARTHDCKPIPSLPFNQFGLQLTAASVPNKDMLTATLAASGYQMCELIFQHGMINQHCEKLEAKGQEEKPASGHCNHPTTQ